MSWLKSKKTIRYLIDFNANQKINRSLKMLILKLYPGQTIWIGKDVQVTVLGNLEGLVRVGVQTRELRDIQIAEEEFWNKGQIDESQ